MNTLQINEVILGNVEIPKDIKYKLYPDYSKDIEYALSACNGLYEKEHLRKTKSYIEFYNANPMLEAFIKDLHPKDFSMFSKELFYSMLCEVYVPCIPTELVALFLLSRKTSVSPNRMMASIDRRVFKNYMTLNWHNDKQILKKLIDNIWKMDVNLVTKDRPMVINNNIVEIYVSNIDDILLCNSSVLDVLHSTEDVKSLSYSNNLGVVVGDTEVPLRTLINKYIIVRNDLDLREVSMSDKS